MLCLKLSLREIGSQYWKSILPDILHERILDYLYICMGISFYSHFATNRYSTLDRSCILLFYQTPTFGESLIHYCSFHSQLQTSHSFFKIYYKFNICPIKSYNIFGSDLRIYFSAMGFITIIRCQQLVKAIKQPSKIFSPISVPSVVRLSI